jgi:hypothetical protein
METQIDIAQVLLFDQYMTLRRIWSVKTKPGKKQATPNEIDIQAVASSLKVLHIHVAT